MLVLTKDVYIDAPPRIRLANSNEGTIDNPIGTRVTSDLWGAKYWKSYFPKETIIGREKRITIITINGYEWDFKVLKYELSQCRQFVMVTYEGLGTYYGSGIQQENRDTGKLTIYQMKIPIGCFD